MLAAMELMCQKQKNIYSTAGYNYKFTTLATAGYMSDKKNDMHKDNPNKKIHLIIITIMPYQYIISSNKIYWNKLQ